jgi:hypothetical protein
MINASGRPMMIENCHWYASKRTTAVVWLLSSISMDDTWTRVNLCACACQCGCVIGDAPVGAAMPLTSSTTTQGSCGARYAYTSI